MLWNGCWRWKLPLSHIHGPSFYRSYIPFVPPVSNVSKTLDDTYTTLGKAFILYGPLSRVTIRGSYEMSETRPQSGIHRKCLTLFPEKLAICVLLRKKLSTVLRKTENDDLMKFSLEQLCAWLCAAQAKKWWNEHNCLWLCVGYPSQIISLDWGHNVLNNTLKYYWYSFSFHLGLYKKYAVKQKCSQVLWVLRILRFQKCSGFMRSRPFYQLHWSLLLKIHVKRC
jgi:hypothetical protein